MMDCLDNMVGIIPLTETCPCLVNGLTQETKDKLAVSTSGLYLEHLEGGVNFNQLKAAAGACEQFATLALRAKDAAVKAIKERLVTEVSNKFTKSKEKYVGYLGDPAYNAPYTPDTSVVGMRILPNSGNKDVRMTVKGISIATFQAMTTTVQLYKALEGVNYGTLIGSWNVTTTSQVLTPVQGFETLYLPMNENGMPLQYYVVYNRGTAMPMNLQPTCNCPGVNAAISQYVRVQGVELSGVNDMPGIQNQFVGGVSLMVELECRADGLICAGEYDPENPISIVLANAILNKMGEYLIEYVQNSENINRLVMMNREYMWGKRDHFRAATDGRLEYIGDVIDISASNCFICKEAESGVPTVVNILA